MMEGEVSGGQSVELSSAILPLEVGPSSPDGLELEPRGFQDLPNGFNPGRLQQLLDQVEDLKKEQEKLRNEQEGWNAVMKERDELKTETQQLRSLLSKTEEQCHEKMTKMKQEYEYRLEKVQKERDSMVVNYAKSEKEVIVSQNHREAAEKKARDSCKERDLLLEKIKAMNAEKSRICGLLDTKCNELLSAQRELEKMKEEINSREIKARWGQNKLKAETESHKETQSKYEKSQQQVKQLKDELDELKRVYVELKAREAQAAQQRSPNGLNEEQLLEEKAKLIVEKQSMEEQFTTYRNALKEFENLRVRHTQLVGENEDLMFKLQTIMKERAQQDQEAVRLKDQVNQQLQALTEAQTKLAEAEGVQAQLERERERLTKGQEELAQIRQANSDLEHEIQRCRQKEMELLEFTQRLTEKNVQLQSELTILQEKCSKFEQERAGLTQRLEDARNQAQSLQVQLNEERDHRTAESSVWAKSVSEKSQVCEDLQTQVRELQNELSSVKRKQAVNMKELTRELRVTKKRLEQVESDRNSTGHRDRISGAQVGFADVVSLGSRTSSNTSINTAGNDTQSSPVEGQSPSPTRRSPNDRQPAAARSSGGPSAATGSLDWERNVLVEKMVKIQRENARQSDKIDFLEEHVTDLVNELKKKNRLLQMFLVKEESGVLTDDASDRHKAELAKHSGIMSSMYNQKGMDSELSLELCLEINRKLQSVLEDTLLKNITLKDNLSTLGAEVARITQEYQCLLQQQQSKSK